jgi:hypothetical protein
MQILQDDLISAVSSSASHLSATYPIGNVQDDIPSLPYICNATTCTITLTVSSGMQALFLSGLQADSGIIELITSTDNSGQIDINTTPYSSLTELATGTSQRISPEWFSFTVATAAATISSPYAGGTISEYTQGPTTLVLEGDLTLAADLVLTDSANSIQRISTGAALGAATVFIMLTTSTDRKDSPVSGNAIYQWDQSSGVAGRFEDSSGAAVNLNDFANVMIGSVCTIGGTDYQVTKIIGDGTGASDVELSSAASDATVTAIKHPIKLGIARAGSVLNIENPQLGLTRTFTDYSVRRPLLNGGYSETQRNVCKGFNVSAMLSDSNVQNFEGFYRAFRSKPFPAIIAEGLDSARNENTRMAGFYYLRSAPSMSYATYSGSYTQTEFQIHEVI